jgi:hypothetical protein
MAKRNQTILWIAIGIVALYLFAPGVFSGLLSTTGGGTTGEATGEGVCGDNGQLTLVQAYNDRDAQDDRVSTSAYLFQMDGGTPMYTGIITTQITKPANFTNNVDCQSQYVVAAGNSTQTGYYYSTFGPEIANKQTASVRLPVNLIGTVTGTLRTDTNATYAATTILTLGAGESGTVTLRLKEGRDDAIYGKDGYVGICISHSTTNETAATIENLPYEEFPVPNILAPDSGEAHNCYKVQVGLEDFAVKEVVVGIHAKAGIDPTSEAAGLHDVYLMDWANFVRNDQITEGFTNTDNSALDLGGLNVAINEGILVR